MSVQDKIPNLETQKRIATALESLAKTLSPSSLQTYIDERINSKRLETYPVGYVWLSFSEKNPSEIVGGTWELVEQGRMLLSAGSDYSVGSTGGNSTHYHWYGFVLGGYFGNLVGEGSTDVGALGGGAHGNPVGMGDDTLSQVNVKINNGTQTGTHSTSAARYESRTMTSSESSMPPYISVYMFRRTA